MLRDPVRFVVAVCAANSLAFITPNTSPFVVGALVDGYPMSQAQAGAILTAELLVMGAAAMFVAPLIRVVSRRKLAAYAALLAAAANALVVLGLAAGEMALTLARVAAGAGAGILLATANAAIAESVSPPRLYGFALMTGWIIAAALGPVMATAVEMQGYVGAYAVWMMLALIAWPLVAGMGERPVVGVNDAQLPGDSHRAGFVHIAGIALIGASMMAYFAFVERFSQLAGFTLKQTGVLFAAISISGALGAGLAGLHGDRYGLVRPLLLGTAVHALAIVVATSAGNKWLFVAGAMVEGISFMYLLAYQLALAATLDRDGKWAAAASGAMMGSTGIGPYIGGVLLTWYGPFALNWLIVATAAMGMTAFWWVGVMRQHVGADSRG